jgi:pimeloyl-ACP methyl ester carboxylesterase
VILDGVVPPELALGPATALDAESALTSILSRCTHEPDCQKHFGDPAGSYHALRTELQSHPVSVRLADPTTGAPSRFEFTAYHLATVLRLASYTPEQAALLPLVLHDASESRDFIPLAAQFLLVNRSYGKVVASGMHNTVVCAEDVPFYDVSDIDRARLERTYLGTTQLDGLRTLCKIWPRGPIDADFHAPLRTDVPVLLLSGSADPVTPPAYAEQARRGFSHSLHVVLQGFGHGQLAAPCVDRVMAQFMERASVSGLDVSCTHEAKPMPFFTSLNGPAP